MWYKTATSERKSRTGTRPTYVSIRIPFVGLAPVRLLRPNMAVLYHVNRKLQRAYHDFVWTDRGWFIHQLEVWICF